MRDWLTTELVLATLLVTSFACVGLLALWAATSPRHWFVRTVPVVAVLSLPLLIPAYEPIVVFALKAIVVVIGVQMSRWWSSRRRESAAGSPGISTILKRQTGIRFSLTTLLLLTPLVAVIAAIINKMVEDFPPQNVESWTTLALNGFTSGCTVLLAAWMFNSRRKWLAWTASLAICLALAALMAWFDWLFVSVLNYSGWPPQPSPTVLWYVLQPHPELAWFAVLPVLAAVVWMLLYLWHIAVYSHLTVGESVGHLDRRWSLGRIVAGCIFGALIALMALPSMLIFWKLLHPSPIPYFATPQPNGREDIVAAARAFASSPILNTSVEPKSTEELAAEVAKYAGAYQRLRLGLSREIRVIHWPRQAELLTSFDLALETMQQMRSAARGLMREAELAAQQGRFADAARISLENMRLGQAVTRDGLLVDYLVGITIEGIGDHSIYPAIQGLNAVQCREAIGSLSDIETRREPLEDVYRRDRIWSEHAFGWQGHFQLLLDDVAQESNIFGSVRHALLRKEAATRLLIVELALRAFHLEHGVFPDELHSLVPEFLDRIPVDPFSTDEHPLRYARPADGYVLYSVGYDGDDDGGRPPGKDESGYLDWSSDGDGDLRLDFYLAPYDDEAEESGNDDMASNSESSE